MEHGRLDIRSVEAGVFGEGVLERKGLSASKHSGHLKCI
jgi:hypothetical protein